MFGRAVGAVFVLVCAVVQPPSRAVREYFYPSPLGASTFSEFGVFVLDLDDPL